MGVNEIISLENLSKQKLIALIENQKFVIHSLEKEEKKYQDLLNNSLNGVYKSTPEGKFVEVNIALVTMLGYDSKEELLNIDITKDLYFDIKNRDLENLDDNEGERPMVPLRKKDGTAVWVEDSGISTLDNQGNVQFHMGFLRDVSERKMASKIQKSLLKISQEGHKTEELRDFIKFIMNELGELIDTENFYIAFYNEEKQTLNIPFISGEVADTEFPVGKSMTGYLIKKNKPFYLKSKGYKKLIDSGEIVLIGKFPAVWLGVPLRVENKVIGAIVVQNYDNSNAYKQEDIELLEFVSSHISLAIQKKKSEEELSMSKQILRNVLDNIPTKVFWKDKKSRFLGVNAASLKEMGIKSEKSIIGKSDFDFHDRIDAEKYKADDELIMASGEARLNYHETQIKNGKERFYITSKLPFYDEDNRVIGLVGTSDDITEQKEVEIKLKKAIDEAISANLSKSTFLANMSHEIRTPMNAILGYSQLLQDDDNLTKNQQENLQTINRSGEHLLSLINDILDMSKIEAGRVTLKLTDFNLYELLKEIEQLFALKAAEKNIELSLTIDTNIPKIIYADESKIKQIMLNLIGNALKFTAEGFVRIYVENNAKNEILFKIKDSGKGIATEEHTAVFKPFEQAQKGTNTEGGTGLGLAISKKLANLMQGDISVESEYGKGSEFFFNFQYSYGNESLLIENVSLRKVKTLRDDMKNIKVAIVDDRFENRDILYKKLNPLGFVTRMAENGQEAVDLYKDWKPDIILMDVVMPVMNGVEATRQILEFAGEHEVKIFVVSASALESEQKEIMDIGATSFIKKPVKFDELLAEMHDKAGVQFIYEDIVNKTIDSEIATPLDVPESFKIKLLNAATEGDFMLLQDLLNNLEKETNKSFKIIENAINEMEFEAIVNWLNS